MIKDGGLKLLHVVHPFHKSGSGLTVSVSSLCTSLGLQGHGVELHVLEPAALPEVPAVELCVHDGLGAPIGLSRSLFRSLRERAPKADVLHVHGLWSFAHIYAPRVVGPEGRPPLIVSPHGTLSKWALRHHRVRKTIFWRALQRAALTHATCLHATAENEADDIRRLGFRQPIAVIANGVDVPQHGVRRGESARRRLLFVGRLHPLKALERVLEAWGRVAARFPEWDFVVAGPEDQSGYGVTLQSAAHGFGAHRVHFPGAVYGQQKLDLFESADIFVLPSHSENFGMVVAEALAHGLPVIASLGTPWSRLREQRCGWWAANDVGALEACLLDALSLPARELRAMGERGRKWMLREFGWQSVGEQMADVYRWLSGDLPRPSCIRAD